MNEPLNEPPELRGRFLALFKALRVPFGYEESCKLTRGRCLTDRCLVSLGRDVFGGNDAECLSALENMLPDLAAPAFCADWLSEYNAGAGVIHFGFEAEGATLVHKIYLEYVREARAALAIPGGPKTPVIVHRALKWRLGTNEIRETHYRLMPQCGLTLDERLAQHEDYGDAIRMVRDILRQALVRAKEDDMILLDVADTQSLRHSFDLQIYDAGLRLGDVAPFAMALAANLDIDERKLRSFFASRLKSALGHIAGGCNEKGEDFATLYFGVQSQ